MSRHEFSPLANEYGSVNLGQGFPDWDPPDFVIESMQKATDPSFERHANQYARPNAHLPLATVLAQDYSAKWGIDLDPTTNIGTAVGCTNALYCVLQGLLAPGDEVLLLEPAFDIVRTVFVSGHHTVTVPGRLASLSRAKHISLTCSML